MTQPIDESAFKSDRIPFHVVVPAAGVGARLAAGLAKEATDSVHDTRIPKQYLSLQGDPILEHTLARLLSLAPITLCLVVGEADEQWKSLQSASKCQIAIGGSTRAESVRAGLDCLQASDDELVLVHDAVRPLVALNDIENLIRQAAESAAGALLATPVIDTLKLSDDSQSVVSTPDRSNYWHAQTPQAFSAGLLRRALDKAMVSNQVAHRRGVRR